MKYKHKWAVIPAGADICAAADSINHAEGWELVAVVPSKAQPPQSPIAIPGADKITDGIETVMLILRMPLDKYKSLDANRANQRRKQELMEAKRNAGQQPLVPAGGP